MTPSEIIAELRDIHLPSSVEGGVGQSFAPEPLAVLAVVVLAIELVRWRRRTRWQRTARRRLGRLAAEPDTQRRFAGMVDLLQQIAPLRKSGAIPDEVFLPPSRRTEHAAEALSDDLRRRVG